MTDIISTSTSTSTSTTGRDTDAVGLITDVPTRVVIRPGSDRSSAPSEAPTVLSCRSLGLRLGGSDVLISLSLEAAAGEWIALLGPNGAGKSSALRVIAGSLQSGRRVHVSGDVAIHGRSIRGLSNRAAGRLIAVVPQSPIFPVGVSTFDYVMLGRTPHLGMLASPGRRDRVVVHGLLERLDLTKFALREVRDLSGGERQRAVIARALAQQAPVLVLDEPTSALDVGHQQQVLELVDTLRVDEGLVVVSAMHDLSLAGQYAHKLILLSEGEVVSEGSPRAVLDPTALEGLYHASLHGADLPSGHIAVLPVRTTP